MIIYPLQKRSYFFVSDRGHFITFDGPSDKINIVGVMVIAKINQPGMINCVCADAGFEIIHAAAGNRMPDFPANRPTSSSM